ncbi:hypothetical protein D9M73_265160 [compost metagenome]
MVFEIGRTGPQRNRCLDRPLALQAQVQGLRLVRHEVQCEQVVVLADFATGERQGVAGLPGQLIVAACIWQIQIQVIEGWVSQLQQPGPLRSRV